MLDPAMVRVPLKSCLISKRTVKVGVLIPVVAIFNLIELTALSAT